MKNGNVYEFVDRIYFGDELWFLYKGDKYFLEGWYDDGRLDLYLYKMTGDGEKYVWKGGASQYPVEEFLNAKIWDGKSFWEVEQDLEWVDC